MNIVFFRRFSGKWLGGITLVLFLCGRVEPSAGQTIRDKVKQHVEESLEKSTKEAKEQKVLKKKKKNAGQQGGGPVKQGTPPGSSGGVKGTTAPQTATGGKTVVEVEAAAEDKGPKLPLRVIHKNFQLDLEAGGGYRAWVPQQYPTVHVDMANYFTWHVEVRARLFQWLDLSRGYYESSSAANPRPSEVADATQYGSYAVSAAWLILSLGFPVGDVWEPAVRYEARSFLARAKSKEGATVCIVPYDQSADTPLSEGCPTTDQSMSITSNFETALVGVNYYPARDPMAIVHAPKGKVPSFFFGAGYIGYAKPYQVTIGTETLEDYLFTGRFRGGGLAVGMHYDGGVNAVYLDAWVQLGLGETRLTKDMTLNELAPEDWLIGYLGGNVKLGARIAFWKFAPTLMFVPEVTVGGASFFFFQTGRQEGEKAATPMINWDVLYTIRASLILTL
jgi:hypothetical protein